MAETQVTVTIENLAPEAGIFLTPFWVGFHDGNFDIYDRRRPITTGLERLVEDGDTAAFSAEFLDSRNGILDGTIAGESGIDGPIDPGETVTATFTIDSEANTSQFFSYASMVIPSNDAFIANGDSRAFRIFDEEGNFIGVDFILEGNQVLDAGTEVNDELADSTAFFSQAEPNTGEEQNGLVTSHPGFTEDGRILSEDGTTEGAPAAFNNADFKTEDYQVARITVSTDERSEESPLAIANAVDLISTLDGDSDATGTSTLTLNTLGNELRYSLRVFDLDFGANGLIEGGAQTEDTSDDVTRINLRNGAEEANNEIVLSLFDTVETEFGNVLDISGNQDEDLTVTTNDDGSVTLEGVWEETDPESADLREFVSQIRDGREDEELDLYWNVHTEEFPDGAIRGELVVDNVSDSPPEPVEVIVTVENLAPEGGTFLTPFWVGFHDGDFDVYDRRRPVTTGLERLVEDGDTAAFSEEFLASRDGIVDGTIAGESDIDGPIDPGETVTTTFTVDSQADTSQFLSYASMVIPSNDAFVANGSPRAVQLFDEQGNFIAADFIIEGSQVLDAGTEVNDELADSTAFFSQAEPNTGEDQDSVVTIHPGFAEDGRILSEDGSTEGAPAAFNNADFKTEDYQLARVSISVVDDPVNISATLDGEQEVDEGDSEATGTSTLTLNDRGDSLEYSLTVSGLDFGANGLIEGGAQTEDTDDDVTRLHIHNAPSGENGDIVFSLFDTVDTEFGDVLDIPGNQDEDLTVTANDDGSVTLTGVWEESDPSTTALREFVPQIRDAEPGEELDLYWNVHTEEFPAGAIRGQLVAEGPDTIELFRFRNTTFETGTYLFVGEEERDAILQNPDFNETFELEGVQEDGLINAAFTASTNPGEDLTPFYRLQSIETPGTYLFAGTSEYNAIFAEDSDQRDKWIQEGLDGEEDIPEFYLFDGSADRGTEFNRFQNTQNNTFLYAGPGETEAIENDSNFSSLFNNQGVAFESLG
jgi:HSP20 family molecular chaperone IbpA